MDQERVLRRVSSLVRQYDHLEGAALLRALVEVEFPGKIAVVSSFGSESAVLLALLAEVDPTVPVIFIDTGKMFEETLAYRDTLAKELGLKDLRIVAPAPARVDALDPAGRLWQTNPDACCALRKVEPLDAETAGFEALISGRKRYHGALRSFIPRIEAGAGVIKVDPIATWSREQVEDEFVARGLPRHPLEAEGYLSIGCQPCTVPVGEGAGVRDGRWSGLTKTECGIHNGKRILVDAPAA